MRMFWLLMASKGPNDLRCHRAAEDTSELAFALGALVLPPRPTGRTGVPQVWGASGRACCSQLAITLEDPLFNFQNFVEQSLLK